MVAKLVFFHGYSDHIGRYNNLFQSLVRRGIAVYGFDQRGWGRSVTKKAEKGLTGPTARVMADAAAFVAAHLPETEADPPLFVAGHSMGGGEALYLASDPLYQDVVSRVRGWLLESPFIGFSKEAQPWAITILAGRLVGRLLPHLQLVRVVPAEDLTRDPAVVKSLREDPLCHDTGTLEGLAGLLDRTISLGTGKVRPAKAMRAMWIAHGTADKTTNYDASKKFFDMYCGEVQDKQFRTFDKSWHQLHTDEPVTIAAFEREFGDWILERSGKGPEARL